MKNFVQDSFKPVQLTTASAVVAGEPIVVEDTVYIPLVTNSSTDSKTVSAMIEGIYRLPKASAASGQAINAGSVVYWDATNKQITETSTNNTKIGHLTRPAASIDEEGEVSIRPF